MNERETHIPEQELKKSSKKTWLFLGLGVAATGALSYFGWQYWKKHKAATEEDETDAPEISESIPKPKTPKSTKAAPSTNAPFPLKMGSKGQNVKSLQSALIAKYGKEHFPKYGSDGYFGKELQSALKKFSLPRIVTESVYNSIVKLSHAASSASSIGKALYRAALKKDFLQVTNLLKTLKTPKDYKSASDEFSLYRLNGVHQTLVNGLLNSFSNEKQKETIRSLFKAIGLKNKDGKWSLSGIDNDKLLITTQASKVWKNPKTSVAVPANMVLGKEVARRGNYTVFENEKQYFLVQSADTNYYTN